jgi:hypothetical protein
MVGALALMSNIDFALGGECMDTPMDRIMVLEKADLNSDKSTIEFSLYCFTIDLNYVNTSPYIFEPDGFKSFDFDDSTRARAFRALIPILESSDSSLICGAIKGLAYFKWPESFEHLKKCEEDRDIITLYAINDFKEAMPVIVERYRRFDKRYKTKPQFSLYDKYNCLGALYHLGTPDILPFIDSIIENPKPPEIKRHAEKVRLRILEKYPEARQQEDK